MPATYYIWTKTMRRILVASALFFLGVFCAAAQNVDKDSIPPIAIRGTEVHPQYPGGIQAFYNYISKNLATRGFGKMVVQFIVEKDGSISNIKVLESIDEKTDKRMVKLLKKCLTWTPGYKDGKPVRALYTLPITISKTQD
jgi:periplasmic protein TonB